MYQGGTKGAQIACALEHPVSTVYTVLRNFQCRGAVESPKSPGRPKKLSNRDKRSLGRALLKDRRQPLAELTSILPMKVHTCTVRTSLHELGFQSRVAVKKPFLSDQHKAKRLKFAKEYKKWTVEDWKSVIWTDESSFEIGKNTRQTVVWRKVDERHRSECLAPTFKSGRTSTMVWGAFVASTKLPLVFMPPGRRTATDFVEIVYEPVLGPFLEAQGTASNLILMEDGAPVHRSNTPKCWRQSRKLKKLEWPANSPDLNPIENLWKLLKDHVQQKHRPAHANEMNMALTTEWEAITSEKLESLVASMPERIAAVIRAKGGATRW
jgi:transposase